MKEREMPGDAQGYSTPTLAGSSAGSPAVTDAAAQLAEEHGKYSFVAQMLAGADAMYAALRNLPCRCLYNVPYAGLPEKQVVTTQCARCKSMREWELLMCPPQVAA